MRLDDLVALADAHPATEAAGGERPQEGDEAGRREGEQAGGGEGDGGPVEELPAADADGLGIRWDPHGGCHRVGLHQIGAALLGDRSALDVATGGGGGEIDLGVAVAATGLAAERAGTAHVGPTGDGDEADRAEDDDDRNDDGDDCSWTHTDLTARRTSRLSTAGRS